MSGDAAGVPREHTPAPAPASFPCTQGAPPPVSHLPHPRPQGCICAPGRSPQARAASRSSNQCHNGVTAREVGGGGGGQAAEEVKGVRTGQLGTQPGPRGDLPSLASQAPAPTTGRMTVASRTAPWPPPARTWPTAGWSLRAAGHRPAHPPRPAPCPPHPPRPLPARAPRRPSAS